MLTKHAEGLWTLAKPASALGMPMGIRMTVVRLGDGGLWLHSPVPLTDAEQQELEALGPVRCIVSPNLFHHLHARTAKERFPQAKLFGAPGLAKKRKRLAFDGELGDSPDPAYAADLRQCVVRGMPMLNEVVFLHPATRTLIVTDFVFHFRTTRGLWMWLYMRISAKIGALAQSWIFRSVIRDKAAYRASVETVLGWDFDRVVMSHGEVLESGGEAALKAALAWLRLPGVRK